MTDVDVIYDGDQPTYLLNGKEVPEEEFWRAIEEDQLKGGSVPQDPFSLFDPIDQRDTSDNPVFSGVES